MRAVEQPRPFSPRPYQKMITDWILEHDRCAIYASMGVGKSVSTLNALDVIQMLDNRPHLVIAPLRVATTTWPDEVRKWDHLAGKTVLPITGSEKERLRALRYDAEIYSVNFEQIPWLVEHYGERWPFSTIVVDESTKLKGFRLRQGTQRAKALGRVAHSTKVHRLIELTGTPAPNGLEDLWGQAWFLDKGGRLGRTYDAFKQRWFREKRNGYGTEPLEYAQEQIQRALKDICLTIDAKDWFDLREPIVNNIYVDLPSKARTMYDQMEKEMFAELAADRDISAVNKAVKTMRCLHMTSGFSFYGESKEWMDLHDAKISALEDIIEEASGAPVLVGYQWVPALARLQKAFPDGLVLSRTEDLRKAQQGRGRVWFGHPASMGHGVDGLQEHCNIMAYFDHWWNLEERDQILGRVGPTRQMQAGKDRAVFVHNLVARDTVDDLVIERTESKRSIQDILLDAMKVRGLL